MVLYLDFLSLLKLCVILYIYGFVYNREKKNISFLFINFCFNKVNGDYFV